MKRTNPKLEALICKEYRNGNGYDLSKKFRLDVHTIYKLLKRNGISANRIRLSPEMEFKIIEFYKNGMTGYEISERLNVSYDSVYRSLKRHRIKPRTFSESARKYTIDEAIFDNIDCEWKAYFLGLFYADGCITKYSAKISLQEKDKKILEKLNKYIYSNRNLLYKPAKSFKNNITGKIYFGKPQFSLEINNIRINSRLRELGLYEKKSLTLDFPNDLIIPLELKNHFIRGYFDGDGSINIRKYGQRIDFTGSNLFCKKLNTWISQNLNITGTISNVGKVSRLYFYNKKDIITIYNFLYQNHSLCLNRKYEKMSSIINSTNIEKVYHPKYSSHKYVTFDKRRNKWMVNKKINKKNKFFGYFDCEENAITKAKTI